LKRSNFYSLLDALKILEKNNLFKECSIVFDKMSNKNKALEYLIRSGDMKLAIEYVIKNKEFNDSKFWQTLFEKIISDKNLVNEILKIIEENPKIINFLKQIDNKLFDMTEKNQWITVFLKLKIKIEIFKNSKSIAYSNTWHSLNEYISILKKPIFFKRICQNCSKDINQNLSNSLEYVAFKCNHSYHKQCIEKIHYMNSWNQFICPKCNKSID